MLSETFLKHFQAIEDPRLENHNHRHELTDILVIAILGTICGADTWTEICEFAYAKEDWLKTFLKLPHSIPSHDTFGRVFSLINPNEFESCFLSWIESLVIDVNNEIIAIDGKTLRGAHHRMKGKPAWCDGLPTSYRQTNYFSGRKLRIITERKSNNVI